MVPARKYYAGYKRNINIRIYRETDFHSVSEIARGGVLPFREFGQSSSINLYTAENSSWPYKFLILL